MNDCWLEEKSNVPPGSCGEFDDFTLSQGGRAVFKLLIRIGLGSLSLWESRASARRSRPRKTSPRSGSALLEKEGDGRMKLDV